MHGITDGKLLSWFVHGLDAIIGHEVFKENLQIFKEACVFSERILQVSNLVSGGGILSKWCKPPDFWRMDLDSIGAY